MHAKNELEITKSQIENVKMELEKNQVRSEADRLFLESRLKEAESSFDQAQEINKCLEDESTS